MPALPSNSHRLIFIIGVLVSLIIIGVGTLLFFQDTYEDSNAGESSQNQQNQLENRPPPELVSPSLRAQLPFDTDMFENGYQLGSIWISLNELIGMYSLMNTNKEQQVGTMEDWQMAANAVRNNAVVINEAIRVGFRSQTSGAKIWYSFTLYEEANAFLNAQNASQGKVTDTAQIIGQYPELTITLVSAK